MKRLRTLSLILSLCITVTSYAYDVCIDGIYYNLVPKAKQAQVTSGDSYYSGDIVIPEKITSDDVEYAVTSIGNSAFANCSSLTSIVIPNSVTSIGSVAFDSCSSLTSIVIPNSVTSIGYYAFKSCEKLTDITIGSSITYVGSETFANCPNLENVYCNAVNPPSTSSDAFDGSYIEYANLYVPAESMSSYRSTDPWSGFGNIQALTPAEPEDVDLVDGEEYTNMLEKPCNTLTYTRNFTNTNWNALYVPFAMQYNDWSADFEVARLNDVHQFDDDEDGEIDRTVLELIKLKDGSSIEPNTPYLIKAKEIGEKTITLTDATLYAAEENSFDVTSWFTKFTFTGTYSTVTDMATKGHYAMADGGLKQATTDAAMLGAFRWYLDVTDRNGNPTPLAGKKVLLSFDDGETTEVANVSANSCGKVSEVHTVSGMKIAKDKALQKGVYIIDGNKILVR